MEKCDIEEELRMLDKIYNIREEEININDAELRNKLNEVILDEIKNYIENNMDNKENQENIFKKLDLLIEKYEIKMGNYLEKGYKQGFKDTVNLILECMKNK